jgi:hypothetical protein
MDQGAILPPPLPRTAEHFNERLMRLELTLGFERQSNLSRAQRLELELAALKRELYMRGNDAPHGWQGWLKLFLAVTIPFTVWLFTGSLEKAYMASKMVGGP